MKSILALAIAVLALSGCNVVASPPKGQKRFSVTYQINPAHNGAIKFAKGFSVPPTLLWRVTLSGYLFARTLVAEGKVFVLYEGDNDSQIAALDLKNGQIRWQQ